MRLAQAQRRGNAQIRPQFVGEVARSCIGIGVAVLDLHALDHARTLPTTTPIRVIA